MPGIRSTAILALCISGTIEGQPAVAGRFEVVSVKPSNAGPSSASGIGTGHGRLDANNVTLKRCIMGAYSVGPNQIAGGPEWVDTDRFAILAKADQPINDDAVLMSMLQDLLADRFKLVLHRETRAIPAFVLEVAKNGPKLEKAVSGESSTNTSTTNTGVIIEAHNLDMESFAKVLSRKLDRPVVNATALPGIFNLKVSWTPENVRRVDGAGTEGPSIFTAIQEQLGLRLRSEKTSVEILVIDHAEKPSEN